MGFINKLCAKIIGKQEAEKPAVQNADNSISSQGNLINSIEKVLKGYYKGQKNSFDDKILKIWVKETLQYDSLKDSDFVKELTYSLYNQIGAAFSSIELSPGPLPEKNDFTKVTESVYIQLYQKTQPARCSKAMISAMKNYGSMIEEKYILDAQKIEQMPSKRYNIGIGESPEIRGRFRINHIAIDDDPECSGFERNRHVSRTHAYIRYSTEDGFLLHAEPEGTMKAGKRTRILREEAMIEVDDVVAQPLKDGDCIELNRNVRLMFRIITN